MNKHSHRLVLGCVMLAIELVRFANHIIVLVNTVINYVYEPEVVEAIPAQAR
jgi:hypothetical protein